MSNFYLSDVFDNWRPLISAELRAALEGWFGLNPWRRATPSDGDCTTDEPWECYACFATIPYEYPDTTQPNWWDDQPAPDAGTHDPICLWVATRAALTSPEAQP